MKTLYLLRHANAHAAVPPLIGDYERILSAQGTEEALTVGRFLREQEQYPDFTLSSSSVRTIQTARLIFGVLFSKTGFKISSHFDRSLYNASADFILAEIHKIDPEIEKLMVVGHNPGIAELCLQLSHGEIRNYSPGTLTIFTSTCHDWSAFSDENVKLEQVFIPDARAA